MNITALVFKRLATVAALVSTILFSAVLPGTAKVKATSTDGEATIYLSGDFAEAFDVAYAITLRPSPANHAWTGVSLLLVGTKWPGSSLSIGVSRGYPHPGTLAVFTTSSHPGSKDEYRSAPVQCEPYCVLELRADSQSVYAILGRRTVRKWLRSSFPMFHPYIQINGEVSAVGDEIRASLRQRRSTLNGKALPQPICAFSTQGVEPRVVPGGFEIVGSRAVSARVTYISLLDGKAKDSCPTPHTGKL